MAAVTDRVEEDIREWGHSFLEVQKKRRDEEELTSNRDRRKQVLLSLRRRRVELLRDVTRAKELHLSHAVFLKSKDKERIMLKGELEQKEAMLMEAERQRLSDAALRLQQQKAELELSLSRLSVFHHFLQQLLQLSKFEDVREQADHLENLLLFSDQLFQRDNSEQEQIHRLRSELSTLKDRSDLMVAHRSNQLMSLQSKLERARSDATRWEQEWNHIEETAAKKTLLLGKIKMGTLNLYEATSGPLDRGDRGINVNDTDTQLERIQEFIQDHKDIVTLYRSTEEQHLELKE